MNTCLFRNGSRPSLDQLSEMIRKKYVPLYFCTFVMDTY